MKNQNSRRRNEPPDTGTGPAFAPEAESVLSWLNDKQRLLVLAHERPDGDAFGCLYASAIALGNAGKEVWAYTGAELPVRYSRIFPACSRVRVASTPLPLPDPPPDGILCLDTSSPERLIPPLSLGGVSVCNVDHHRDNTEFGDLRWIDPQASAVAEMLATLFERAGWLGPDVADCLLAGLLTDTGGFRFPNTTPVTLTCAAMLYEAGANYASVTDALFYRDPFERRRLEAHIIETAVCEFDGRFMYSILDLEEVRRRGLKPADLEGLIDVLRSVDDVRIACLIQPGETDVRVSLRARSSDTPVDGVAHRLGGGGHPLAAGARLRKTDRQDTIDQLRELVREVL